MNKLQRATKASLKLLTALSRDSSLRKQSSATVVESIKVLECALRATRVARVDEVFVTDASIEHPIIRRLINEESSSTKRIWRVAQTDALRTDAVSSPSVAAVVRCDPEFTRETAFRSYLAAAGPRATVALLHNLQNPTNVGALLRSAAAFDAAVIVTGAHSVDVLNPKCIRASAGALFALPALWLEPEVARVAQLLSSAGFDIVHASASGDEPPMRTLSLAEACARDRVAFLLGNEGSGVDAQTERELTTSRVHIATSERVESLNVGVAGALLLYERQR